MKKDQQIQLPDSISARKNKSLTKLQRIVFSIKSCRNFEIFHFTNPLHEELQIVYANLRV